MALKKATAFKGIIAEYWKVSNIMSNYLFGNTSVVVVLYINDATRVADISNYVKTEGFTFDGVDKNRAQIYNELKKIEQFNDVEDC